MKLEIKNVSEQEYSLYVYGEIFEDKSENWFPSDNDIDINDFKKALDEIPIGATLNMYINSPGGSVFGTSTIISMLRRIKDKGVKINAYVDGMACSCASWLIMIADNINIFKNSIVMIHKPLCMGFGNANDFAKLIETLDKIEDGVIVPIYENKAKCDKQKIKDMMSAETWLTAEDMQEYFNVNFIDETREFTNIKSDLFKNYKNTPKEFTQEKPVENMANTLKQEENREVVATSQPKKEVDYSFYENILKEIKK